MKRETIDILKDSLDYRAMAEMLLFRIYKIGESCGEPSDAEEDDVLPLLAGIALSLWRAIFLIPGSAKDRASDESLGKPRHQEVFKSLIETNSLLFTTEFREKKWTAGYYRNNAWFRLKYLKERQISILNTKEGIKCIHTIDDEFEKDWVRSDENQLEKWKSLYDATDEIVREIFE